MEGMLMATVGALNSSPVNVLRSMRGPIIDARRAYPDVLHVEVRDSAGALWRLATQDAEWSPSDPASLVGRSVENAEIDEESGELRCKLSDGTVLDIRPAPGGVVLEFGPGVRWQISSADATTSSRR